MIKFKIKFDNHAPVVFSIDEIIAGAVFTFCAKNDCAVTGRLLFSGRTLKDGTEIYEGDRVLVQGTKRVGFYETVVIASIQKPCELELNKTYFIDNAALTAIKEVVSA